MAQSPVNIYAYTVVHIKIEWHGFYSSDDSTRVRTDSLSQELYEDGMNRMDRDDNAKYKVWRQLHNKFN